MQKKDNICNLLWQNDMRRLNKYLPCGVVSPPSGALRGGGSGNARRFIVGYWENKIHEMNKN